MLKYHINKWVQVNLTLISLKCRSKRGKPMETWGLGSTPVRIPIKLNSSMKTSKPIIPMKSVVIRTDFLGF